MTPSLFHYILASIFTKAAFVIAFYYAVYSYYQHGTSALFVFIVLAGFWLAQEAAIKVQNERDWKRAKAPGHFRERSRSETSAPPASYEPRLRMRHKLALAWGHPLAVWPIVLGNLILLYSWALSGQRGADNFLLGGIFGTLLCVTVLCHRYRRRIKAAMGLKAGTPVPKGMLAADDANPVRTVVAVLAPTPSVKDSMAAYSSMIAVPVCLLAGMPYL